MTAHAAGPTRSPAHPLPRVARVLLEALEARDMGDHALRVAATASATARRLGMGDPAVTEIALAALLHETGRLAMPSRVARGARDLTLDEHALRRRHVLIGARTLEAAGLPALAPMVRHAEERWDGSGGPDGLAATAIPAGARIIAACDEWDRLRHGDGHSEGREFAPALAGLLALRGSRLDPDVTRTLTGLLVLKRRSRDVDG